MRLIGALLLFVLVCAIAPAKSMGQSKPGAGAVAPPSLNLDSHSIPLGGVMRNAALWRAYVARFVTADGRVVDTGNHDISHSEGQGYGMLLAVAFNDRATFDRIWNWTRANLMVRDDSLFAWRWDPSQRPAVADMNDASDGDILIAWALTEAADYWNFLPYRVAARRIAVTIGRKLIVHRTGQPSLLLPAMNGFVQNDGATIVVNPSYWVYPALSRLSLVAPEIDWAGLSQSGLELLDRMRFGPAHLPSDWVAVNGAQASPAAGFAPVFGYNSIRIPLYMAWAGIGERRQYQPFADWANAADGALAIVNVATGDASSDFLESGYEAPAALVRCVTEKTRFPSALRTLAPHENYYPATLHLLTLVALRMRYPSCLAD